MITPRKGFDSISWKDFTPILTFNKHMNKDEQIKKNGKKISFARNLFGYTKALYSVIIPLYLAISIGENSFKPSEWDFNFGKEYGYEHSYDVNKDIYENFKSDSVYDSIIENSLDF